LATNQLRTAALFDSGALCAQPDQPENTIISFKLRLVPRYSSRVGILKIRFLWSSAAAALAVAAALAGCGGTTYFAGRNLPPSRLTNRVMIAIQNPSAFAKGTLQFVDAFYDRRAGFTGKPASYFISGYSGALPATIQNMPEEQAGYVYGSGDGSFTPANYAKETSSGAVSGLNGLSSSIFITRSQSFVFAASQNSHVLTVVDRTNNGSYPLSLPGVYRVSVNPGGTMALAFVQNSNYAYYPVKLSAAQTTSYSGGPATWPLGAVDCEPQNAPGWCLFQALDPTSTSTNIKPLVFDRPVKAVFSIDGGTAYVLNCGPECGGNTASVSTLPVSPMIFPVGRASGTLPTNATLASTNIAIPGGASNALVDSSTMYVVGQQPQLISGQTLFAGNLTVVNLSNNTAGSPIPVSDGEPGARSRLLEADNNTLWIGMTKCNNGVRAATGLPYGCLTMYNTSTGSVTLLEPYLGDATGIAAVTGLNKIYTAEGGQVYIYSTVDGTAIDNQYVTVTGTAFDVAYMDATTDANNTVY
jgi:hypothetical protein